MSVPFRTLALAALFLAGGTAHALPVSVADTATSGGAWSGNTFTPNAANAVVSRADVLARLASGEVTIQSTGTDAITVATSLAWNANTLILKSGGDIRFNASQSLTATAGLVLEWGLSGQDVDSDLGYFLADGVKIDLAETTSFKTRRGSNGDLLNYRIITRLGTDWSGAYDAHGLQWKPANQAALGADIDASATASWNGGKQYVPGFTSRFAGLGHTIDRLHARAIDPFTPATERNRFGGLFTTIDYVQDLRLTNVRVQVLGGNEVGGVAGRVSTRMRNVHVTGEVRNEWSIENANPVSLGGLAGRISGSITDSSNAAAVIGDDVDEVGGLVGTIVAQSGYTANIVRSRNTGAVEGSGWVGGLAGKMEAANYLVGTQARIVNSRNTGTVNANTFMNRIGGLAGSMNRGEVVDSHSVATIGPANSHGKNVGGLVGEAWGVRFWGSFSAGLVRGQENVGGLAGSMIPQNVRFDEYRGSVERSFSLASVEHSSTTHNGASIGGLVGDARGVAISQSFSAGPVRVRTAQNVGGLVGNLWPYWPANAQVVVEFCYGVGAPRAVWVDKSYSISAVTSSTLAQNVGGLVGRMYSTTQTNGVLCPAKVTESFAGGKPVDGGPGSQDGGLIGSYSGVAGYDHMQATLKSYWDIQYTGHPYLGFDQSQGGVGDFDDLRRTDFWSPERWPYHRWDNGYTWWPTSDNAVNLFHALREIRYVHVVDARMTAETTYTGSASAWNGVTPTITYSIGGTVIPSPGLDPLINASGMNIGSANPGWQAGTYEQPVSGLRSNQFTFTYSAGLTVKKAPLTVRVLPVNKTYDGTPFSATAANVEITGFVGGENASVLQGTLSFSGSAQGARNAGSYTLVPGGLTAANYEITYISGPVTITPTPITLRAVADTKMYDGTAYSSQTPAIVSGLLRGGDTIANLSQTFDSPNVGARTLAVSLGYAIQDGNGGYNYQVSVDTATPVLGSIVPAPLAVRANSASKAYDGAPYTGGNGVQYFGFVNGEGPGVLAGTLTYGGTSQGATTIGTGYTIVPSGLYSPAGNYQIQFIDGILTIGNSVLTVRANDATRTYDGTAFSGHNGVTFEGFVDGDTETTPGILSGTLAFGGNAQGAVNAGNYAITPSGLSSSKYDITFVPGTLAIERAALTVTADNKSRTYDRTPFDDYSASITGFVNGEGMADLQGALTYRLRTCGGCPFITYAPYAGDYIILPGGLTSPNYAITWVEGQLNIARLPLIVTAYDYSRTYTGVTLENPGWAGLKVEGFLPGDSLEQQLELLSQMTGTTYIVGPPAYNTASRINAGTYTMQVRLMRRAVPGGLQDINPTNRPLPGYTPVYVDGVLTITPAPLTITARDDYRANGSAPYTGWNNTGGNLADFDGFVNGEDRVVLTPNNPTYSGNSWHATAEGFYDIIPGGQTADYGNYTITYVPGTLTIGNPAPRYAITLNTGPGGNVACTPNPVNHGQDSTCTATALPGFTFTGWGSDCAATDPIDTPTCTLVNVQTPQTVSATFTDLTHPITVTPSANGSVTCTPNPVNDGGISTCTATPASGYTLASWGDACAATPASNLTCTLTNVQAPQTVSATFQLLPPTTHAITVTPSANGSVVCTPNPVNEGADSVCTATPASGYALAAWGDACTATPASNLTCTLTNVQAPQTVSATFQLLPPTTHAITVTPSANGAVVCTPNPVNEGADSTCTATPASGYTLAAWGDACAATPASSLTCMLANVQSPQTVSATFTNIIHAITVTPSANGSVVCTPNPVNEGADSTCTATPASGYTLATWGDACAAMPASNLTCTLTNVQAPQTVSATFTNITHPITVTPSANGAVVCTPNPVNEGADSVCTATPASGYALASWGDACAATPASSLTCTLANVQSPQTVSATFTNITHAITVTPSANGTVTCTPNPVNEGADSVCTATPASGYALAAWGDACAATPASNLTCTLANVQSPQTVSATFTNITHTITITPSANGTVTCTPNPVNQGGNATCTATPDSGYALGSWGSDCAGTSASSLVCTLIDVRAAASVGAQFTGAPVPVRHIPALDRSMQALLGLLALALGMMAMRVRRD